ncbi:MAG: VOC family protein [Rhodothermaceae bacterium]
MATINTYLTFKGNCEEAFNFYKSVFGGDFAYVGRFKEMPPNPDCQIAEADKEKIMHISLPISKETVLMGSDSTGDYTDQVTVGNNFSISINSNSVDEAKKLFTSLSEGGIVKMPMEKTFWGAYFGMFQDKFGINWMVNCALEEHK